MIIIGNTRATSGPIALEALEDLPYFTFQSISQLTQKPFSYVRVFIHRLISKGEVISLKRGTYMSKRFHEQHAGDDYFLPAIAYVLNTSSYVSLEYILQKNNILTDVTYAVTSITLKKPFTYTNMLGNFDYKHIQDPLFRGFEFYDYFGIRFAMCNVEKALFDYLYLRPLPQSLWNLKTNVAEELRLNLHELNATQIAIFREFVEASKSKKLKSILRNFNYYVWKN